MPLENVISAQPEFEPLAANFDACLDEYQDDAFKRQRTLELIAW